MSSDHVIGGHIQDSSVLPPVVDEPPPAEEDSIAAHLKKRRNDLMHIIDTQHGLLDELLSLQVLTLEQIEIIERSRSVSNAVSQLVDDLIGSTNEQREQFLLALERTNQKHVVNYIRCDGTQTDDTDDWPLFFSAFHWVVLRNYKAVVELIDPLTGLLDELLSIGFLNHRQKEQIEAGQTNSAKNKSLVGVLLHKGTADYRTFLTSLMNTKQHRVASLLGPEIVEIFVPLSPHHEARLVRNHSVLIDKIYTEYGLVSRMYSAKCITSRQKEFIESANLRSDKISRLLEIVKRGSASDFEVFVDCLNKTGQRHISRILLEEGTLVLVDAKTNCSREQELQIVESFMSLMENIPGDEREELRNKVIQKDNELKHAELLSMNVGNSISLLYFCKTIDGLRNLEELHASGELDVIIQELFNLLLDADQPDIAHVNLVEWDASNYMNCMEYFYDKNGLRVFSVIYRLALQASHAVVRFHGSLMDIDGLPYELIEMILMKTAGQLFVCINRTSPSAAVYSLATLSAVSSMWRETFTYRKFSRRLLKQYFRKVCRPFHGSTRRVTSLLVEGDRNVVGIAEWNGKLYVACDGTDAIKVFTGVAPYNRLEDIAVPGLNDPNDIVIGVATGHLYIADWNIECAIWRVNLTSNKQIEKYITIQWGPRTLSVNRSSRILITPRDGDSLYLFGDEGVQLNRIELPGYMDAYHAIETPRNTFTVSHYNRYLDRDAPYEHHGVSQVDVNGIVSRTFTNRFEATYPLEFKEPYYLVLDDVSHHVIVADALNERVVLLQSNLELERILIKSTQQGQPRRLCLSTNRFLFVSFLYSSYVDVFLV